MANTFQQAGGETFSAREIEVLKLLAAGKSDKEIAHSLVLSVETIKWYNKGLYGKLGVHNRTEAAAVAQARGLLEEEGQRALYMAPPPNNLPAELTSFVGREREIGEVVELLRNARLVTLTGPGGAGKTRLSLQVARSLANDFADGVIFVSLASTTDPSLVAETVAHALDISEQAERGPVAWLKSTLADKELLLLLDNFEQVIAAAPLVTELLAAAPSLSVLSTSRESLRLTGEREYSVPPLLQPVAALDNSLAELTANESVALFVQRAEAVSHNFQLSEENAQTVAAICRRLDGLPLAIELAAARIKLFPVQEMLARLENRLRLLTGGAQDLPARQRTLKSTLDWSYDLLNGGEQSLFARMSVFRGGATMEAVEAICGPDLELDSVDGLASLLDKSLLYQEGENEGRRRFSMLETIREYARLKLVGFGQEQELQNRHLHYFAGFAGRADLDLWGFDQVTWLKRLDNELGNMRAALDWSASAPAVTATGLQLAASLARYWDIRCYYDEGRAYLAALLAAAGPTKPAKIHARATFEAGRLAYAQGDYLMARAQVQQSLTLFRGLGAQCRLDLAHSLRMLGDIEVAVGNYELAANLLQEALQIFQELSHKEGEALALWQLAWCMMHSEDFARADRLFGRSVTLARQVGGNASLAMALSGLGELAVRQGNYERAREVLEESMALNHEIHHTWGVAASLGTLGWAALRQNDLDQALRLLAESLVLRQEIGDTGGIAWCLERLAEIALLKGRQEADPHNAGAYERAARLFGAAEALREKSGSTISSLDQATYESDLKLLKSGLAGPAWTTAWQQGRAMTREQAVAYALDDVEG